MRKARIYLAIVAYYVLIKRLIYKSFRFVFYNYPETKDSTVDNFKLNTHSFKFNRLEKFFSHNDSNNLGLHNGFLTRHLLI